MNNLVVDAPSPITKKRWILAVLNYFVGYLFLYPLLGYLFCRTFFHVEGMTVEIAMMISLFMIVSTILLLWPLIKESIVPFRKQIIGNMGRILIYFIGLLLTTGILSLLVTMVTGLQTSNNQQGIVEMFQQYPFYIAFNAVIFAPIVEELIFRGCFFRSFSSKHLTFAIVLSSFMFGFVHVSDMVLNGNLLDGLFIIVYSGMGLWFAHMYKNSQSILPCMLLHMFYNSMSVLALTV